MSYVDLKILPQPNDETCGVTCLQAIYRFYKESISLEQLIKEVPTLDTGGTLAVILGSNALEKGYKATIYTYNLHVFDPTWFNEGVDLKEKIKEQLKYKKKAKVQYASNAYLKFLEKGGEIKFEELTRNLLIKYLDREIPILTGLNATYLYRWSREIDNEFDDLRGMSMGHFVVLYGYDAESQKVNIADPLLTNPFSNQQYKVDIDRLVNSIMLGILTYDANFLVIEKKETATESLIKL